MDATPRTVPAFLEKIRQRLGSQVAQEDSRGSVTFDELLQRSAAVAEGLRRAGVRPGDRVGLLADNSRDWLVADLATQIVRAVSVPRGTDTPTEEIADLFRHAEVGPVFAHDEARASALEGIRERIPSMREVFRIDPATATGRTLDDLAAEGRDGPSFAEGAAAVRPEDVATIIYTSGTTGRPKGVVLTQANFGHQVEVLPPLFVMGPKELFLSILPPWHIFERTVEYAALACGARLAYTNRRHLKEDLVRFRPTFMASVPRLWETVHQGIRKSLEQGSALRRGVFRVGYAFAFARAWAYDRLRGHLLRFRRPRGLARVPDLAVRAFAALVLVLVFPFDRLAHRVVFHKVRAATGGRMRGAISGGGLMPPHVDRFFRTVEVPILVGYGLTETSPVVTARREERNVLHTIGTVIPGVEVQIRHPDTGAALPTGETGLVFTRGPHVMRGYYRDDGLTRDVIDAQGWFNTGDLGALTEEGDLCFRGRAKETIVLAGGENVEPSHVESALLSSRFVQQAYVVGQDRKTLAALLLPEPTEVARALGLPEAPAPAVLARDPRVRDLLRREAVRVTSSLAPFERITRVALLSEPFDVADGTLTQTLKLRRHVINVRYKRLIDDAYVA